MSAFDRRSRASRATGAFTLIEIVLVVAVLAAIAGLVVASLGTTHEQSMHDIALHELGQVRQAILQFKADTGFLPKRGPFNIHETQVTGDRANDRGRVRLEFLPPHIQSVLTPEEQVAWFDEPANLWQLFECPFSSDTTKVNYHPLATWDPARRRGWRGPYLVQTGEGHLVASRRLATNGLSSWTSGDVVPYFDAGFGTFPVVIDPFVRESRTDDDPKFKFAPAGGDEAWSHGRPIVVFDLDPLTPGPTDDRDGDVDRVAELARIVSFGPDGRFDGATQPNDDLTVRLLR